MKLELFEFVDEAMERISIDSYVLDSARNDIAMFLKFLFNGEDYFLNVNSRVKTPESVKEKILQQNMYKKYNNVDDLIAGISDLIGIRIECRFIPDEEKVYSKILQIFDIDMGGGYYSSSKNTKIAIKLDEPQPQYQKNGFEIYKVDGHYITAETTYNFEVQIKSLVNNFWGDIEHRILYKNYSYMLSERFIKDIMSSIKENLSLIDKQLRVVYDHVFNSENRTPDSNYQIKDVVKKITYDIYFSKIRNQLGIVVDFKNIVDLIVDYVFLIEGEEGKRHISENFLDDLSQLAKTIKRDQNFDDKIEIERIPNYNNEYEKRIALGLCSVLNQDFRWNLFFRIIFDLKRGSNVEVLEDFITYLVYRFRCIVKEAIKNAKFIYNREDEVEDYILNAVIDYFLRTLDVESLDENSLKILENNISGYLLGIISWNQWNEHKEEIYNRILNFSYL